MLKNIVTFICFLITLTSYSQEEKQDYLGVKTPITSELKGQVISGKDKAPLSGAHIFNMNSVKGSSTRSDGTFEITAVANDTIFLSYIGYQSVKIKITNDLLKGNELIISLFEKTEQLQEVTVTTALIGVLEIDAKNIPTDKYARIHIKGLPQTYEVGRPSRRSPTSVVDAVFQPVDFVYNLFGNNPKQLKKLKKLKSDEQIREMLNSKADRELMLEYLELSMEELNDMLDDCNYSEYFIKTASDIQVIEAVLECYDSYKAVKQGSTKKK